MQTITTENNSAFMMTIGWDIGGAHVKMVMIDTNGQVVFVEQLPCPLWKGLDQLTGVITKLNPLFSPYGSRLRHAITMTGELVDVFTSREAGVMAIAECLEQRLSGPKYYFALNQKAPEQTPWVSRPQLSEAWLHVASANWAASATFIATLIKDAVIVDIGSSTTDIILIQDHRLATSGKTDAERMAAGELCYTGVVRTPLMALGQQFPFRGQWVNVAAEYFATTADIYRLTGHLAQDDDMTDTADGQDKSLLSSARRLSRMIGRDVEDASIWEWQQLASHISVIHQEPIRRALLLMLSRHASSDWLAGDNHEPPQRNVISPYPLIAMGAGAFVVKDMARQWNLNCLSAEQFVVSEDKRLQQQAQVCFPAYAVAALLIRQGG